MPVVASFILRETRLSPGLPYHILFLLLALGMRLIAMLIGGLRVLLGAGGVLLALCMIALAVMFGGGTVRLCSILVMLGGLIVFVSCHGLFLSCALPAPTKSALTSMVPSAAGDQAEMFLVRGTGNVLCSVSTKHREPHMSKMPPIPPGNQSTKGPKLNAEAERDTSKDHKEAENSAEQGETANIKQNTTNAGFFKGRRVK